MQGLANRFNVNFVLRWSHLGAEWQLIGIYRLLIIAAGDQNCRCMLPRAQVHYRCLIVRSVFGLCLAGGPQLFECACTTECS